MSGATQEDLARLAVDGDRQALERLIEQLQSVVYGLAIRMLWNREDAEDATQDILVRVVTRLAQFDFRSQLRTWAYRIAVNYLLDVKKSPVERQKLTFEAFAEDLAQGLSDEGPGSAERSVLVEEVKIGCTLASSRSRARNAAWCPSRRHAPVIAGSQRRCKRSVSVPESLDFASASSSFDEARATIQRVEEARRTFALHRENPPRASSAAIARRLVELFGSR